MNIRRLICALLALLMMALPALAEDEEEFGFEFADDEGYTGDWLELDALGIELCLPDGWAITEPGEGEAFAAAREDGAAAMAIRVEAEGVADIGSWAEENLAGYEMDDEDIFDTIYAEQGDGITAYRLYGDQLLAFDFIRDGEDGLSLDFALQIVGSANELWTDDFGFYEEGDEADPFAG